MKPVNCVRHLGHRRTRLILGNLLLALALTWAGRAVADNVNSVLSDLGLVLTVSLGKMHERSPPTEGS
jgi:hypothetical protein